MSQYITRKQLVDIQLGDYVNGYGVLIEKKVAKNGNGRFNIKLSDGTLLNVHGSTNFEAIMQIDSFSEEQQNAMKLYVAIMTKNEDEAVDLIKTMSYIPWTLTSSEREYVKSKNPDYPVNASTFLYNALNMSLNKVFTELCIACELNDVNNSDAEEIINLSAITAFIKGEVNILKQLMQFELFNWEVLLTLKEYSNGAYTDNNILCIRELFQYISTNALKSESDKRTISNEFIEKVNATHNIPIVVFLFIEYFPFVIDNKTHHKYIYDRMMNSLIKMTVEYKILLTNNSNKPDIDVYNALLQNAVSVINANRVIKKSSKSRINR